MSGDEKLGKDIREPVTGSPSSEGGKVDDKIDQLKEFFSIMGDKKLGHLYELWSANECADPKWKGYWQETPKLHHGDKEKLDQLRGVNVGTIDELAKRLSNVGKASDALATGSKTMGKRLDDNWKSPSSSKAVEKFDDLRSAAGSCKRQADDLATQIQGMRKVAHDIRKNIGDFADKANSKHGGIVHEYDWLAEEARDGYEDYMTRLHQALKYGIYRDKSFDYNPWHACYEDAGKVKNNKDDYDFRGPHEVSPNRLRCGDKFCDLKAWGDGGDPAWSNDVCQRLDRFCANYYQAIKKFRSVVNGATKKMQSSLKELSSAIDQAETKPFAGLVAPGDTPPKGYSKHSGDGSQSKHQEPPKSKQGSGGDTNPANTGGGDSGGGGGSNVGDQGGTAPQHEQSGESDSGRSDAGDQGGTAMPKDGQGSDSGPSRATGSSPQAAPEQPDDGSAGGASMPGRGDAEQPAKPVQGQQQMPGQAGSGQPQTVSVKGADGQDIQMSSPDGQGNMKLTIDDGSGHAKSYDVDFSQASGQTPGGGQPGQDGMADLQGAQGGGEAQGLGQDPGQSDGQSGDMPGESGDTQGQPGGGPDQAQGMPGQAGGMTGQEGDASGQLGGAADQSAGLTGQPGPPDQSQGMPGQSGDMSTQPGGMADQGGGMPGQSDGALGSPGDASGQGGALSDQLGGAHGQADGMPGQSGDTPGQGAGGQADGLSGQPGDAHGDAGDIPGQSGSLDGSQHVQADQQGHAEIHDGDTKITVDKSPDSDEVKVTVDDGSGKPTSYTLDSDSGDSGAGASGADQLSGGGGTVSGASAPTPGGDAASALGDGGHTDASDTGAGGDAHDASGTTTPSHASADSNGFGSGAGATPGHGAGASPDDGGSSGSDDGSSGLAGGAGDSGAGQLQQGGTTDADPSMAGGGHSGAGAAVGGEGGGHAGGAASGGAGAAVGGEGGGHGGGGMPPMMGGMGGMGGGGDQERQASAWRTEGNLFDDIEESIAHQAEDFLTGRD